MSQNLDEVKRTIKDLLNLASNDAAYDGEVTNAMKHAQRLMTAYHLSEDELTSSNKDDVKYSRDTHYSKGVSSTYWELNLAGFVCKLVGSTGYYYSISPKFAYKGPVMDLDELGNPKKRTPIYFYGTEEDVALASSLYKDLSFIIYSMSRIRYGGALRGAGRNYAEGFVEGLMTKLTTAIDEDKSSSVETNALIVKSQEIALRKKTDALAWLKKEHNVKLSRASKSFTGISNYDARNQGRADGTKLNVSASRKDKVTGQKQRRIT